jgi:hypothetical protein
MAVQAFQPVAMCGLRSRDGRPVNGEEWERSGGSDEATDCADGLGAIRSELGRVVA